MRQGYSLSRQARHLAVSTTAPAHPVQIVRHHLSQAVRAAPVRPVLPDLKRGSSFFPERDTES